MSSDNVDSSELIALYQSLFVNTLCNRAAATLFIYDYIITFGQEVELFWRGKLTGATAIFLSNRYLFLTITIYTMMMINITMSDASCVAVQQSNFVLSVMLYIPWAVFSALRTYALCRSKIVGAAVFLLAMGTVGINFAMLPYITGENDPDTGCTGADSLTLSMARNVTIISRTCQIASDAVVIIITWIVVTRKRITAVRWLSPLSIADTILRDGIAYFLILLILNSLQLTFTLLSMNVAFENISYVSTFTEPLTSILVSRYLLDLQMASTRECNLGNASDDGGVVLSSAYHGSSTLGRFVGSLGSSIYPDEYLERENGTGLPPLGDVEVREEIETAEIQKSRV